MKYWNGSDWVSMDAKNVDTVDNIHFRVNIGYLEYSTDGTTWAKV
jgi:hypothetical protein